MKRTTTSTILLLGGVALAACGGASSAPSDGGPTPATTRTARGAITAKATGSITVNGVALSTAAATVRIDGQIHPETDLRKGMIVTVKGGFDDRAGEAVEVEAEHGIEGQVDDKGTDFVVVGGQVVHVDDSTEFGEDNPLRLGSVAVGDPIGVFGVPDDMGGIHAARVDDSPRAATPDPADDDDFDVTGFVSNAAGTSFQLRVSPEAAEYWIVDATGLALPANGAYVEVHSAGPVTPAAPPVLGTIVAASIHLEDRFGGEQEIELEGIVTMGDSAEFMLDGVTVQTDAATVWALGAPADLVPGVRVEAEGSLDAAGVLHAEKVSFRAGVRITAALADVVWDGTSGSATLLGVPVQLPSFARYDVVPADGLVVEVRGNPSADGAGVVALRVADAGSETRVFLRAVATAKDATDPAAPTFTVLGFLVTTAGAEFRDTNDAPMAAADFAAAVEPGRTVLKVRARRASDVVGGTFQAEELEIEGNE